MCYTLQDAESSAIDAEATCAALGGHIAFSSDGDLLQAMNEFALETTQDTWWLGLNAQDGCEFVELDGTEMRYTNWADGEPNGCDSCDGAFNEDGECCVHVYTDGTWNDIDCVTDVRFWPFIATRCAVLLISPLINSYCCTDTLGLLLRNPTLRGRSNNDGQFRHRRRDKSMFGER